MRDGIQYNRSLGNRNGADNRRRLILVTLASKDSRERVLTAKLGENGVAHTRAHIKRWIYTRSFEISGKACITKKPSRRSASKMLAVGLTETSGNEGCVEASS